MNAECKTCDKRGGYFCTEDCDHWGDEPRSSDTLHSLVGACRSCKWARSKTPKGEMTPYDGGQMGWCDKDGMNGLNFVNRREPDLALPANDCWEPREPQAYQRAYAEHVESGEPLVAPGLQMALKGFDIRGPLQRGFA